MKSTSTTVLNLLLSNLHDDTGHDVFKRLLQLGEAGQAGLHHAVGPLVHLGVLKNQTSVNPPIKDALCKAYCI